MITKTTTDKTLIRYGYFTAEYLAYLAAEQTRLGTGNGFDFRLIGQSMTSASL